RRPSAEGRRDRSKGQSLINRGGRFQCRQRGAFPVSLDRLRGAVRGGGEWALVGSDGYLRVDVRAQVETNDGAFLYVQYLGLLEVNAVVQNAIANQTGTQFEHQHFYTNPRFETGDARYSWLNTTFFIGEGRMLPGLGVEYRIWHPA
ncbi:MAG: DUF3237 domain-containing protein, partial [Terricaulis sp.]